MWRDGESVKRWESPCTVDGNVNWCSHYGEQYGNSLKKLGTDPLYDSTIPLLGIYPEKTIIEGDTYTPIFIAALFTIARAWKQHRYQWTVEWIKKLWYIYNGILLSHKKKAFESVLIR